MMPLRDFGKAFGLLHSILDIFQSDLIEILARLDRLLHSILDIFQLVNREDKEDITLIFTFHSGYIPIYCYIFGCLLVYNLYIPFWIYSNFCVNCRLFWY